MAVVGLAQLSGQVNPAEVTQKFQESAQLNDERVKVFLELEAKAAWQSKRSSGEVVLPEVKLAIALRYFAGGDPLDLKLIYLKLKLIV